MTAVAETGRSSSLAPEVRCTSEPAIECMTVISRHDEWRPAAALAGGEPELPTLICCSFGAEADDQMDEVDRTVKL
jgi:hypothetical protein